MTFGIYEASVPVFSNGLANMREWLGKAAEELDEAKLMEARLAPDMRPLPGQYQMASDSAKNALARSSGSSITSCTVRPGNERCVSSLHCTPVGRKRFSGSSTESASALLPMRQRSASVFSRAPSQVWHGV